MGKIGLGIITCNRDYFYEKCIDSIKSCSVDELVTVNDGKPYGNGIDHSTKFGGHLIQHTDNKGVGISKNEAMKYLLEKGCDHIFLIEDDIIVTDSTVFDTYIATAQKSGLWHLMFGYHGPANKHPETKKPLPRLIIEYGKDHKVALNRHCVGAFCYYHKNILNKVGLMDEVFKNAWEHVEHSYQIVKAGMLPGYWWWPDVAHSYKYLDELACSEDLQHGTIRPRPDWQANIQNGVQHFRSKHTFLPITVPDTENGQIVDNLKVIGNKYRGKTCTI